MKTKLTLTFIVLFLSTLFGMQELKAQKVSYYVLSTVLDDYKSDTKNRPCVSNVVKVSCNDTSEGVIGQFREFFNAYHKKKSGWNIKPTDIQAWDYDSAEKAERKRRELIANYNSKDYYGDIYYVSDFNYICDDKN